MRAAYLELDSTDPALNLAVEQLAFDELARDGVFWMLWQNEPSVIVGKYQNTSAEINERFVAERGIRVVRRLSGGGAVYHDLGNLNYTIIAPFDDAASLDMRLFCAPLLRTLESFGIRAECSGRNDVSIDGSKISGCAQYVRNDRVLHHGTILFRSDLGTLSQALLVDERKVRTRASRSIRSRVVNVADHLAETVTLAEFRRALLREMLRDTPAEAYVLSSADRAAADTLRLERYDTWEWNYGQSPPCEILRQGRAEGCGSLDIYIGTENGRIASLEFKGDFFGRIGPERLAERFLGFPADEAGYRAALRGVCAEDYLFGLKTEDLLRILLGSDAE